MIAALLVALREGVEAALVVGIVLLYLARTGRRQLARPVWVGVALAAIASGGLAALLSRWQVNQDGFEGVLLVVAAAFVVTVIVWMNRVARNLRKEIEQKVEGFAHREGWGGSLAVGAFVFLLVVREGVELALILRAVEFSTASLEVAIGTVLGLAIAIAVGIAFFQGTLRVPLGRFFKATSLILTVVALQLLVTGLHEMSEATWLPSSRREMALVGPIVRNEVFFFVLVLGVAAVLAIREWSLFPPAAAGGASNPADHRREQWERRRQRRWLVGSAAVCIGVLIALSGEFVYNRAAAAPPPATAVASAGTVVRLPAAALADPPVHFFTTVVDGTALRFLTVHKPDGTLGAALDACQICGAAGFTVQGSNLVCRNCSSPTYIPSVGSVGGCNPIGLPSHIENGMLIVDFSRARMPGGMSMPGMPQTK
ncbi:MAG TPA: Fe-S-containing protein [Candidatus Acidoferrales bacterium]|nr:Fe-S-containing protein [Candidatus Acidoferrales bacterium]